MPTINYNGMELEEITEPQIFDPPKLCLCFNDEGYSNKWWVSAILPKSSKRIYPIVAYTTDGTPAAAKHCAEIPEEPKPRRATWKQLAYWLMDGKGLVVDEYTSRVDTGVFFNRIELNEEVSERFKVMRRDDTEWHEPTLEYMGLEADK